MEVRLRSPSTSLPAGLWREGGYASALLLGVLLVVSSARDGSHQTLAATPAPPEQPHSGGSAEIHRILALAPTQSYFCLGLSCRRQVMVDCSSGILYSPITASATDRPYVTVWCSHSSTLRMPLFPFLRLWDVARFWVALRGCFSHCPHEQCPPMCQFHGEYPELLWSKRFAGTLIQAFLQALKRDASSRQSQARTKGGC